MRTAHALETWTRGRRHLLPTNDMDEAAADIGVSKEQLSGFFLRYYHTSFYKWRKELRIAEAKSLLLRNPSMSLSELGEEVGIVNRANMRRQFLEETGMTPAQWLEDNY